MTCKRTLPEIRATATKAARGAGCPWGLAEEAGMAAKLLQSHGLAGAEAVSTLLTTPRACACDGRSDDACSLRVLASISDAPPDQALTIDSPVVAPVLILASLLLLADENTFWRMDWKDGHAICGPHGLRLNGTAPPQIARGLHISKCEPSLDLLPATWSSQPVDERAWKILLEFASKTYVPESDQSRASGAGPDR